MAKYRKKPVVVDAIQFEEGNKIEDGYQVYETEYPEEGHYFVRIDQVDTTTMTVLAPAIRTLEGWHIILPGDYVITGIKGERYPCKPDIFNETYELVDDHGPSISSTRLMLDQ